MEKIIGKLSVDQSISGSLSPPVAIQGSLSIGGGVSLPEYDGNYTVTPSATEQILQTENKITTRNITVKPIPSNYGLISWNGSILTVS